METLEIVLCGVFCLARVLLYIPPWADLVELLVYFSSGGSVRQLLNSKISKVFALTLVISATALGQAKADVDPVLCGFAGAGVGAAVGRQLGQGRGKDAATIIGGLVGAAIGANICKQVNDPEDLKNARQNEYVALERNSSEPIYWDNPRFRDRNNSDSRVERRGRYMQTNRECRETVSRMRNRMRNGSEGYYNKTIWCEDVNGRWSEENYQATVSQVSWYENGVMHTRTQTMTTRTESSGGSRVPPVAIVRPDPRHVPQQPVQMRMTSEQRAERYARAAQQSRQSDLIRVAERTAESLDSTDSFLSFEQLAKILQAANSDKTRNGMLEHLVDFTDTRSGGHRAVLSLYDARYAEIETAKRIIESVVNEQQPRDEAGSHRGGGPGSRRGLRR